MHKNVLKTISGHENKVKRHMRNVNKRKSIQYMKTKPLYINFSKVDHI